MKRILIISIIVLLVISLIGITVRYCAVSLLCDQIALGENISTHISNGFSCPPFLNNALAVVGKQVRIPLVEACYHRNVQAVKELLINGADPNLFIRGNWSPMEALVVGGPADERSLEIAELLITHGCDVNLHASEHDSACSLSAPSKSEFGQALTILLLQNGAEDRSRALLGALAGGACQVLEALMEDYIVNMQVYQNAYIDNYLIYAVRYGDKITKTEMVSILLDYGMDPNEKDLNGKSAIDYARELSDTAVLDILCSTGEQSQ